MFKEFEKEMKKKTPNVPFHKLSLESEKARNNTK